MSFRASDYHPDWKNVVRQIRDQAGNKCEFCGVPNGVRGARDLRGDWVPVEEFETHGWGVVGDAPNVTTIVLTTAHLCWKTCADKKCIDPTHLRALCQRCHLNYDREHHLEVQRQNREAKRLQLQPSLLEVA
jgi:hypothetical protein